MRLAVKDVFHMQGLPTTAGNPDWLHSHSTPEHTHSGVLKLLEHGAVFVGKTITDELAYSLNGQNTHYGTPTNFAAPKRLPGGSSSGSASAVSGGFADIGLGTDTGGSIRVPASYNGLFGLRPTHGVTARDNMVALAPSFDTVGWMTKDLSLLNKVAEILLPPPTKNTIQPPSRSPSLGLLVRTLEAAEHNTHIENWLSGLSAPIKDDLSVDPLAMGLAEVFRILQGFEVIQEHGEWLNSVSPSMADDIATRFKQSSEITQQECMEASAIRKQLQSQLDAVFSQCDVILVPTTPGIAPLVEASADALGEFRKRLLSLTAIAGLAGLPQLHLPLFTYEGAPCGVSLIGQKGDDFALMRWANKLIGNE